MYLKKHEYDEDTNVIIFGDGNKIKYEGIEIKIDIYQSRVIDWFFSVAKKNVAYGMSPGDYVSVMIGLAYIEGVEQFRMGKETPKGKSGEWFKRGIERVFPGYSKFIYDRLWKETRCGLFHVGFPNGKIYLSHDRGEPISQDGDRLYINPNKFVEEIAIDFNNFIFDLKDVSKTDLWMNFEKLWDHLWVVS